MDGSLSLNDTRNETIYQDDNNNKNITNGNGNNNANRALISSNQHMLEQIAYVKTRDPPVDLNVEMRTRLNQDVLLQVSRSIILLEIQIKTTFNSIF